MFYGNPQSINIGEFMLINTFFSVDLITDNVKRKIQKKNKKTLRKGQKSVNSLLEHR